MKRIIAAVIAATLLVFGIFFSIFTNLWASDFQDTLDQFAGGEFPPAQIVEPGDPGSQIAMINIEGAIMDTGSEPGMFATDQYNHQLVIESLKQVIEDDTIKAVLLNVDSPGGGVYESAEIHKYLTEVKEAGKIIYSSMGGMAASGGYYVSAPADQIFASEETLTGSIGVIMQSINFQQLAEDLGVEFNTYTSGDMKEMLSATSEPSEEETEYVQGMVDSMFDDFVQVVADGRSMSDEAVREIADGRIYLGEDAIDNGLVDQIGYIEDATAALKEEVGGNPQIIEYGYANNFAGINLNYGVKSLIGEFTGQNDIARVEHLINNRQGLQPMYLYER